MAAEMTEDRLLMAANARHSCAAPRQDAMSLAAQCEGRHQLECGEQRAALGLGRDKRAIALLFLEWLAANLNAHPCRRLRIAQKPRPPASVQAQRSVCDDDDNDPAKGAVSVLRGRVSVSLRGDHAMA